MSLDQLPDELIQHLLYYIPPRDTLSSFRLVRRRFARLAEEPLIWRYHCIRGFRYWHPDHDFAAKLGLPAAHVDWKNLFILRSNRNAYVSELLNGILATKVGRYKRFAQIGELGYDAKDFLLEQCGANESAEDVLSRRYYSQAVLDSIHRSIGIEQWHRLHSNPPGPSLERVLGAFDMFVLRGQAPDINDICAILDEKASDFRASHPKWDEMTTRQRALALNRWVRAQNLTGLKDPQRDYRNLRNCLIGQTLQHKDHESIPIISTSIFCCIARRVGLDADCCNFPGHIHAVVSSTPGHTLDNIPLEKPDQPAERMYLDPFGRDEEVPLENLQALLHRFGGIHDPEIALLPARPVSIVNRTGSNMSATYATALDHREQVMPELTQLLHSSGTMNLISCLYASMWAALVLTTPESWAELDFFLDRFARSWPEDAWLIEKYLVPRAPHRRIAFGRHAGQQQDSWKVLRMVQRSDELQPSVFRRSDSGNDLVPFKIGQVFRHKRYGYLGVITGWSDQGTRNLANQRPQGTDETREEAADSNVVNRLQMDNKTYFTYLRTSSPERYVIAEANLELIDDPKVVEQDPFLYAGKFFKRFDAKTCTFVSNNREQYPDD